MMEEEDRIHRRQEICHVTVRPWIQRANTADIVVNFIMWEPFEYRKGGLTVRLYHMRCGLRTGEAEVGLEIIEIGRQQPRSDNRLGCIKSRFWIQPGIVRRK